MSHHKLPKYVPGNDYEKVTILTVVIKSEPKKIECIYLPQWFLKGRIFLDAVFLPRIL